MDASFVPVKSGTNEAHSLYPTSPRTTLPSTTSSLSEAPDQSAKPLSVISNLSTKHSIDPAQPHETTECVANGCKDAERVSQNPQNDTDPTDVTNGDRTMPAKNSDVRPISHINAHSVRSASSPQLMTKPATRSKVYRKTSLKSSMSKPSSEHSYLTSHTSRIRSPEVCIINMSGSAEYKKLLDSRLKESSEGNKPKEVESSESKRKWNMEDVRITCNPLSTPYPYSTPCQKTLEAPEGQEEEPKSRSCGNFLPILSLIPQTVISFQYLSPKMKFSWWRNKIS